jgi:proliferating cell nuclear antigen
MSETIQQNVFGEEPANDYEFAIEGRTIRPFKQLIGSVINIYGNNPEYKLNLTDTGWTVEAVDTTNVVMIDIGMHASAFETYSPGATDTLGIINDTFGSALQHTRYGKSTNDVVTLTGDENTLNSTVTKDVGGTEATFQEHRPLIDPDAVREEVDLPDLNFTTEFDLPVRTFIEAIDSLEFDHVELRAVDSGIQFRSEDDIAKSSVSVACETDGENATAMYSSDCLEGFAKALHVGKVDNIHCKFSDEFPLFVEFEREDKYEGTLMVAPRVHNER